MDFWAILLSISVLPYKMLPWINVHIFSPQSIKLCPSVIIPPKTNIWKTVKLLIKDSNPWKSLGTAMLSNT